MQAAVAQMTPPERRGHGDATAVDSPVLAGEDGGLRPEATLHEKRSGLATLTTASAHTAVNADPRTDLEACPVCAALEGADRRYVEHVLRDPAREQTQAQAIADTLGFCTLHAAHVSGGWKRSAAVARVLDGAIQFTIEMLDGRKADSDSTRDFMFESAHACAACTYSTRMVSRIAARAVAAWKTKRAASESAPAFCFPHYRSAVYCTDAAHLPILAKAELERVESIRDRVESRGAAGEDGLALHLIAGNPRLSPAAAWENAQALRNLMDDRAGPTELPGAHDTCSVCIAMIRDLGRRVDAARWALRIRSDGWMVLPTCAEHLWLFALLAGQEVARRAAEQSVATIARLLRSGIGAVERGRKRREAESKSVWYKPKSPSYVLGLEREVVTRMSPCPVCNGLTAARERAVDGILERVRKRRNLAELEQDHGLCMKHFAHVFLFAPKGNTRDALAAVQRVKLSSLRRDLSQALDHDHGPSTSDGTAEAAWKGAIYRFSGWL